MVGSPASLFPQRTQQTFAAPAKRPAVTLSKTAWRIIAALIAIGFFWLATRIDVDRATAPRSVAHRLLGQHTPYFRHPWWFSLHVLLRKVYSVVAFAIVAYAAEQALPATSRPRRRMAIAIAVYSAAIELVQHTIFRGETLIENGFDIACGGAGGYLGASIVDWQRRRATLRARPTCRLADPPDSSF